MPDVYRGSDIFALPSENETFGQVFVEAMSCGLPVIGTKVGGIPEIISDSYNGYLIPPNDPSILAQRIEKLLNDNGVRDSFIRAGIKTVAEKFTSEKQFLDFNTMLEETVAQSRE
jgi:glycosyltransferase involved in cell wall biosynthesis